MPYDVTLYVPDDPDPIKLDLIEKLSFVNNESYGPCRNFGITPEGGKITLINLSNVLMVEAEEVES